MMRPLSTRDQEILEILISDYIATAAPVGSKTISKKHNGLLSPATIRSIMADLEEKGLLVQPHTSAGRVPTIQGFRYYVDCLLKRRDLSDEERNRVRRFYDNPDLGVEEIIGRTSSILSAISNYVGLIKTPGWSGIVFKQIEFIQLSHGRLLGIFVSQDGLVQNKVIEVSEEYSYLDLEKINRYCNATFMGLTLREAHTKISSEFEAIKDDYDRLFARALLFSQEVFAGVPNADLIFDGGSRLLAAPEFSDATKLRHLLEMLEEKKQLLHILDRCSEVDGVSIFIGAEAKGIDPDESLPCEAMDAVSVVTAPYRKDGQMVGTIGVIGPTRMDYSRIVPIVDFTARVLEDLLSSRV